MRLFWRSAVSADRKTKFVSVGPDVPIGPRREVGMKGRDGTSGPTNGVEPRYFATIGITFTRGLMPSTVIQNDPSMPGTILIAGFINGGET